MKRRAELATERGQAPRASWGASARPSAAVAVSGWLACLGLLLGTSSLGGCSCESCADAPASTSSAAAPSGQEPSSAALAVESAAPTPKTLEDQLDDIDQGASELGAVGCTPCVDCPELDPQLCSEAGCRDGKACSEFGLCGSKAGRCVASSDAACRASARCRTFGYCGKRGDVCAARSDQDCRAAKSGCLGSGLCRAKGGVCVASSDADCAASLVCKLQGDCALRGDSCAPTRAEHCKQAKVCRHGLCRLLNGRCVE